MTNKEREWMSECDTPASVIKSMYADDINYMLERIRQATDIYFDDIHDGKLPKWFWKKAKSDLQKIVDWMSEHKDF